MLMSLIFDMAALPFSSLLASGLQPPELLVDLEPRYAISWAASGSSFCSVVSTFSTSHKTRGLRLCRVYRHQGPWRGSHKS